METKVQISKHMQQYRTNDVKMLYELMSKILLGNNDFRLAELVDTDDVRSVIENETGEKIDFPIESVIGKEKLAVWKKIDSIEYNGTKLKKADRVELIADVMSDETLFEGFCLAFYESDEYLENLCGNYGCTEQYYELLKDPVYQKRKKHMRLVSEYARAAVNLYGVIHIAEFLEILKGYEKGLEDFHGYGRETGTYQNTIMFQPRYLGIYSLQHLIGDAVPTLCTTMDGLLLHACFIEDFLQETEDIMKFFASKNREIMEMDLDEFFIAASEETSYRILLLEARDKQIYLPSKKEFLRYTDENYYEVSAAEKRFRQYLEKKYLANFGRVAKKVGISTAECIDDFMRALHEQATDVGKSGEERDPHEFVQFVFTAIQGCDIHVENMDEANEFLGYAVRMMNSARLWINRGNTPEELSHKMPMNPNQTTVVPVSSGAARILSEGREELEHMGLNIDLDAAATDVSTFSFADGINGKSQKIVKKVYPNDPCPCGSGKKFKKCCAKRQ